MYSKTGVKGVNLHKLFASLDKDHNHQLSREELVHGLRKIVVLGNHEVELIFTCLDRVSSDAFRSGEMRADIACSLTITYASL